MRLGVLEFGFAVEWRPALLSTLRSRDVDIISGENRIDSQDTARKEAGRLARADCDGILLLISENAQAEFVAVAGVLLAGVPQLVSDAETSAAFFESVGALDAIGARFDRMPAEAKWHADDFLETWLQENGKQQRHRGREAARKLYGQSLYVPAESGALPDAALWMHHFGILPTAESENADFTAPTGDVCGALTAHLLTLVSAKPLVTEISLATHPISRDGDPNGIGQVPVTFARITRIRGRFRCLLLRGDLLEQGMFPARFDCSEPELCAVASSPWLHAVPGDHLGAMRAACEALDIDIVLLKPQAV